MNVRKYTVRYTVGMSVAIALAGFLTTAEQAAAQAQNQTQTQTVPLPASAVPGESAYDRNMRLGYTASRAGEYTDALQYFQEAPNATPRDRLATIAYWNRVNALQDRAQPTALSVNTTNGAGSDTDQPSPQL